MSYARLSAGLFSPEGKTEEKFDLSLKQKFVKIDTLPNGNFLLVPENKKFVIEYNPKTKAKREIPVANSPLQIFINNSAVFYTFHPQKIFHPNIDKEFSAAFTESFVAFTQLAWPMPVKNTKINFTIDTSGYGVNRRVITENKLLNFGNRNLLSIDLQTALTNSTYTEHDPSYLVTDVKLLSNGLFIRHGRYYKQPMDVYKEVIESSRATTPFETVIKTADAFCKSFENYSRHYPFQLAFQSQLFYRDTTTGPYTCCPVIDRVTSLHRWDIFFELPEKQQLIAVSNKLMAVAHLQLFSLNYDKLTLLNEVKLDRLSIIDLKPVKNGDILIGYGYDPLGLDLLDERTSYVFTWSPNLLNPHFERHEIEGNIHGISVSNHHEEVCIATSNGLIQMPFSAFVDLHRSPAKKFMNEAEAETPHYNLARQSFLAQQASEKNEDDLPSIECARLLRKV